MFLRVKPPTRSRPMRFFEGVGPGPLMEGKLKDSAISRPFDRWRNQPNDLHIFPTFHDLCYFFAV